MQCHSLLSYRGKTWDSPPKLFLPLKNFHNQNEISQIIQWVLDDPNTSMPVDSQHWPDKCDLVRTTERPVNLIILSKTATRLIKNASTVWASEYDIVLRLHVLATTLPGEDFGPRK